MTLVFPIGLIEVIDMQRMLLKWLVNVAAFYLATVFFPSVKTGGPVELLIAGAVLGLVNIFIKPILVLLTIPINFLTLGLFTLVINTLMVMLTDLLLETLAIPHFGIAFVIALSVSVLNMIFVGKDRKRRR